MHKPRHKTDTNIINDLPLSIQQQHEPNDEIHANQHNLLQIDDSLSATSSSDDLILSSTGTFDLPLIRPAVFANNFSNIENMRFPSFLDLNGKNDEVFPQNTSNRPIIADTNFNIDLT